MTNELARRLEALEKRMNAELSGLPPGGPLRVVIIHGCLPPGEPLWGVAGPHEWLREPGVTKRPRLTPPLLGRSIAWLADRRRDPTPINTLRTGLGFIRPSI